MYEGAPTPVTAFMAVATKVAALGVFLRLFDVALIGAQNSWGPALAVLATITILVGNVGALGQSSLKRMLAYSSVAQAGYMLAGVVVASKLGVQATVFYLAVYVVMNMASFAVIVARERETDARRLDRRGGRPRPRAPVAGVADDDLDARARRDPRDRRVHRQVLPDRRRRLGRLHLAGRGDRGRLDDLARLLPAGDRGDVDARGARGRGTGRGAVSPRGLRPCRAGCWRWPEARPSWSRALPLPRSRPARNPRSSSSRCSPAAATIFFGIIPQPLFDLVAHAGGALGGLF